MIRLDPRGGSGDLLPLFPPGTAQHARLEYGDAAFVGNGTDDTPILVGIEIKRLNDVLQCIGNGRFIGHQLPGLVNSFNAQYLIVEGAYRRGRDGELMIPRNHSWMPVTLGRRGFLYRDFEGWLTTIETMSGVRVRRTDGRRETVSTIMDLHHWWTEKEYDRHRGLCQFDNSQDFAPMLKPGLVRRVAAQLPGISWVRSHHVAAEFGSVLEMALAGERDWAAIKWKTPEGRNQGLGAVTARKVVAAIRGES